jgi:aminoglycoside phosphotransferase (APT) family kinase protein
VAQAVGRGARVTSVRRLRGGSATAVHAVDVTDARGTRRRLVLRRFVRPNWKRPDLPRREANILELLRGAHVPTPEPIAVDAEAAECDVPSLLMTRLPGRVELRPADMSAWLARLAAPLPSIHAVRGSAEIQAYRPYTDPADFALPAWWQGRAWQKLLELAQGPAPETPRRLIHRDYHPTNVLWSRGKISGIIDWVNASMGPAAIDVGHCRRNRVALYGVDAADQFLGAYSAVAGQPVSAWHPYWDALCVMDSGLATDPAVFTGWEGIGPAGLTPNLIRSRLDEYAVAIAARC